MPNIKTQWAASLKTGIDHSKKKKAINHLKIDYF